MKKYRLLILAMTLLVGGCQRQPIDKQEADTIVTQYVKETFKSDTGMDPARGVYYYNKLEEERIEMSFSSWGENIIAENAFVYYIEDGVIKDKTMPWPIPSRIIIVQKENGEYTIYIRPIRPYVLPVPSDNDWTLLFTFHHGEIRN